MAGMETKLNFIAHRAGTPNVHSIDAFAVEKASGRLYQPALHYEDIEMANPTAMGMVGVVR